MKNSDDIVMKERLTSVVRKKEMENFDVDDQRNIFHEWN